MRTNAMVLLLYYKGAIGCKGRFYLSPNRRVLLTWKADHLNLSHSGGGGMDQELVQYLDGRFNGLASELDRRFNDVNERIRHNGVLVEGLRDQVHLLAEGLATHIEAENVRHQAIQEQFRETRALLHLSYEQLHQRVENLERNRPS